MRHGEKGVFYVLNGCLSTQFRPLPNLPVDRTDLCTGANAVAAPTARAITTALNMLDLEPRAKPDMA